MTKCRGFWRHVVNTLTVENIVYGITVCCVVVGTIGVACTLMFGLTYIVPSEYVPQFIQQHSPLWLVLIFIISLFVLWYGVWRFNNCVSTE